MKSSYIKGLLHPANIIINLPNRLLRLVLHFMPFIKNEYKLEANSLMDWLFDLPFYISDILGLPEIFETITIFINPSMCQCSDIQIKVATKYFENSCDISKVWINPSARLFTKKYAIAYVTFNIINYMDKIDNHIFLHELVHICQYQKYGSVYIYRALKAQRSKAGYDYGGYFGISQKIAAGKNYSSLNFEQQAQFIEDFSLLESEQSVSNMAPYNYFYNQFKNLFCK